MKNYVTILDRKDASSISSFQKTLTLHLKANIGDDLLYLATISGNNVQVSEWTNDINNMVTVITTFYGAVTHINITTNKNYTAITPYVLEEKVAEYLIFYSDGEIDAEMTAVEFKDTVTNSKRIVSLIELYEKVPLMATNKEKYNEVLNSLTESVRNAKRNLKGLVVVKVQLTDVLVSFTNDLERLISSLFAETDVNNLNVNNSKPLSLANKDTRPFTVYVFGLDSESEHNYGAVTTISINEFIQMYKSGDLHPMSLTETDAIDTSAQIVNLLADYNKQTNNLRVSSDPLK